MLLVKEKVSVESCKLFLFISVDPPPSDILSSSAVDDILV